MLRTDGFITVKYSGTAQSNRHVNVCCHPYPGGETEVHGGAIADSERRLSEVRPGLRLRAPHLTCLSLCPCWERGLFLHLPPLPAWMPLEVKAQYRSIWVPSMAQHEVWPRAGAQQWSGEASPAYENPMHSSRCTSPPPLVTTLGPQSPLTHPPFSGKPQRGEVTSYR